MRIGKIVSGAEYRMDEQFQNLLIFRILIVFRIEFFFKFVNFSSCKILKFWPQGFAPSRINPNYPCLKKIFRVVGNK